MTVTTTRPAERHVRHLRRGRRSWLWLAVGAALLPFTMFQYVIPVAAWLSPIFLLRFVRLTRARVGLPVVALVGYLATLASLWGIWPAPAVFL